jgi:hypothetical protein
MFRRLQLRDWETVKTAAWLTAAGVVLGAPGWTFAQRSATVFTDVNLIRLDQERVETDRTVVVQGDRIVAIGRSRDLVLPDGADIIDGRGRFLLPGLVDSHVHVTTDMPWAPTRADFGDGLLYLAHGVTTVVNLRGTPAQLEWKQRIAAGELLGPTLYTAGEFVNEPRVVSAADVRRGLCRVRLSEVHAVDGGADAFEPALRLVADALLVPQVPVAVWMDGEDHEQRVGRRPGVGRLKRRTSCPPRNPRCAVPSRTLRNRTKEAGEDGRDASGSEAAGDMARA